MNKLEIIASLLQKMQITVQEAATLMQPDYMYYGYNYTYPNINTTIPFTYTNQTVTNE